MRTVFRNHSEVCHVWASRNQSYGSAGKISFSHDSIYSYGWEMARFVGDNKVLMRSWNYSPTTSNHMSYVRIALSGTSYEIIYVTDLDSPEASIKAIIEDMQKEHDTIKRGRVLYPERNMNVLYSIYRNLQEYCDLLDRDVPDEATALLITWEEAQPLIDRKKEERKQRDVRAEQRKIEKQKAWAEKHQKEIQESQTYEERWLNGESVPTWTYKQNDNGAWERQDFDKTRLRIKDDTVETSRYAYVSVRDAKILWALIKAGRDVKGHRVGHYTVIAMNGTLQIGCHHIEKDEIERFIEKYNW